MRLGLYVHIPFCKQACHYCDFHFSTSVHRQSVILAMQKEVALRAKAYPAAQLSSIYFGGGTPSLLTSAEMEQLFTTIHKYFGVAKGAEVTLEANPDDLSLEVLQTWLGFGINRLSVGIQSFQPEALQWMNRAHSAEQAKRAIPTIREAGFDNFSIDLIYGVPVNDQRKWEQDLEMALEHQVPHLSAYGLTVEEGTALAHFVKKGKVVPATDSRYEAQFEALVKATQLSGMEQYEVSNFAQPGRYAIHNTAYWQGVPYIGVGPSAHSFDGTVRRWNVANNGKYVNALTKEETNFFEEEVLVETEKYNEYVMTGLRTQWGISEATVKERFNPDIASYFLREWADLRKKGLLELADGHIIIPQQHRFLSDGIASALFMV